MPRVSKEQAIRNRETIEDMSSRLFRERGIDGVSVNDLMAAAGLTHGGFYNHFESKDALAAIACAKAFEESAGHWRQRAAGKQSPSEAQAAIIEGFLSRSRRNKPGVGCPMPSLAGDVARTPAEHPVREAYTQGLKDMLAILAQQQGTGSTDQDRTKALAQLSTMVGAMVLARATQGDPLSDELLAAAQAYLLPERPPAA